MTRKKLLHIIYVDDVNVIGNDPEKNERFAIIFVQRNWNERLSAFKILSENRSISIKKRDLPILKKYVLDLLYEACMSIWHFGGRGSKSVY